MSTVPAEAAEVLRGMHLEAVPVRLVRPRSGIDEVAVAQAMPNVTAQEEALRRQVDEATRQGHSEGTRAGYEAGWRKGQEAAAAESQAALASATAQTNAALQEQQEKLSHLATVLQHAIEQTLAAAEDEMVALCFETICRVVGSAATDVEAVRGQLSACASEARVGRCMRIHVHPDDAVLLQACTAQSDVEWVADPEIATGGCIVRGSNGGLDARLETMLEACKAALLAARSRRGQDVRGGAAQ
jgi:flagellar assembly protein FliH